MNASSSTGMQVFDSIDKKSDDNLFKTFEKTRDLSLNFPYRHKPAKAAKDVSADKL